MAVSGAHADDVLRAMAIELGASRWSEQVNVIVVGAVGGNPVACAAALAVLDTIERDGLLTQVTAVGERLTAGLEAIRHPLVGPACAAAGCGWPSR